MRLLVAIALLCLSAAHAATTVGPLEPTSGTWRVYRGSTYVCTAQSEAAALACAEANAETRRTTTRYQIRYPNRYATVTYTAPVCGPKPADLTQTAQCPTGTTGTWSQVMTHITAPYPQCWTPSAWTPAEAPAGVCVPPPVDCAVSAWSEWTGDAWSACAGGTQSRQETRERTVVTQPANDGAACPALTETRTESQSCTVEPPPGSITNLPVVCAVDVAEGSTIRACPWADQRFEPATPTTLVRNCAEASCTTVTGVWRRMGNVTGGTVEVCTLSKLPGAPVVGGECPTSAGIWSGMRYVDPALVARTEAAANRAPTISGTPATQARVGEPYSFAPLGADPDGDTLAYSIANRPTWGVFDAATGRLSGTPTAVGGHPGIAISVSDGQASAALAPFDITVESTAPGAATLSWIPPTANVDGSPLTDLAGYFIAYGTEQMTLHLVQRVEGAVSSAIVTGLAPGSWYFTVRAYTTAGAEGGQSNVASKVVQ